MRILVDTNIFISYALDPEGTGAIVRLVEAIFSTPLELVLPDRLIDEIRSTVARKPHLRDRIAIEDLEELLQNVRGIAIPMSDDIVEFAPLLRDRKDDYLLDAALRADADYLVSGDRDLQDIKDQLHRPRIVTPREFVDLLDQGLA